MLHDKDMETPVNTRAINLLSVVSRCLASGLQLDLGIKFVISPDRVRGIVTPRPFRSKLNRSLCSLRPVSLTSHSTDVTEVQDGTPICLPGCPLTRSTHRRQQRLVHRLEHSQVVFQWNT